MYLKDLMIQGDMESAKEKFAIEILDTGTVILRGQNNLLKLSAGEAIMLLDILKNEEAKLKKIAEEASPISIKLS